MIPFLQDFLPPENILTWQRFINLQITTAVEGEMFMFVVMERSPANSHTHKVTFFLVKYISQGASVMLIFFAAKL